VPLSAVIKGGWGISDRHEGGGDEEVEIWGHAHGGSWGLEIGF
jgi:hypothetical protein